MSVFIIDAASRAAEQALDPTRTTWLKPQDHETLRAALDRPPAPTEKLRSAFAHHQRAISGQRIGDSEHPAQPFGDLFATVELRARLSPAISRTLIRLAVAWELTDAEASLLFGMEVSRWTRTRAGLWKGVLGQDQLTRASLLLGIYRYLRVLLPGDSAPRWLKAANAEPIFGGRSAIEAMIAGGIPQMLGVRRYLAAQAAGN